MGKSEKLFLERINHSAQNLQKCQQGLEIGQLLSLIRNQLRMSQRVLARKANMPQSTISKVESGKLHPNLLTLKKILRTMECDLLVTVVMNKSPEKILKNQAMKKAQKKMAYLQGTMSLEEQGIDQKLLRELINDELKKLLDSSGADLWEDEL